MCILKGIPEILVRCALMKKMLSKSAQDAGGTRARGKHEVVALFLFPKLNRAFIVITRF